LLISSQNALSEPRPKEAVAEATHYTSSMFDWFRKKPPPLTGAPPVRRVKTYSAQSGYVYQYYYQGYRPASRGRPEGTEYVFDVSSDRKTSAPVSVFVNDEAVAAWQNGHGRTLNSTERYAVAKMALFQAFDERPAPESMREDITVRGEDVEAFLATLDIE
ncbi:MAG: hypothetical protein WD696_02570, partial [Bryobacteraceae bacterium]